MTAEKLARTILNQLPSGVAESLTIEPVQGGVEVIGWVKDLEAFADLAHEAHSRVQVEQVSCGLTCDDPNRIRMTLPRPKAPVSKMMAARDLTSTLGDIQRAAGLLPDAIAGGSQGRRDADALLGDGVLEQLEGLIRRARAQAQAMR